MYVFLYVSSSDSVGNGISNGVSYRQFGNEDSLKILCQDLKQQGFHTLIYRTAGRSDARLNRKLLSYADEAVAFILIHEAMHFELGQYPKRVNYVYEEALCDAMAIKGCIEFALKTKMISLKAVKKQQHIFESIYSLINQERKIIDGMSATARLPVFKYCTAKIEGLTKKANQFQKDRMCYPVNNAYFLRVHDYSEHYFELKNMLASKSIAEIIAEIDKRGACFTNNKVKAGPAEIELNGGPIWQWDNSSK